MLAQTTFFIALLTTIALGVLSTNLISAGVSHQHQLVKYATLATDDAVDDFTLLMQSYVRSHGSEGPWPANIPASAPLALCPPQNGTSTCPYTYTVSAEITGASSASGVPAHVGAAPPIDNDRATNLQKFLIDEERVSATVTATLNDANGVVAANTRYLTLRVFEGSPYVMISGQRSIEAINGTEDAIEGDNGGVRRKPVGRNGNALPDPSNPDNFHDTEIDASMLCKTVDAIKNPDTPHPSHNQGRGNRALAWGVGTGGGYELPCTDSFATASPGDFTDEDWRDGNARLGPSQ